jgi:hypothetical protein
MPKVLETSLIAKFDNFADYELYLQNFYSMSVYNGRYTKCEICKTSDHKMRVQYHKCTNPSCYESSLCLKRYVTHICLKSEVEKYRKRQLLEIAGEKHNSDTFDVKKQRGLTEKVKELIEELINEYECKPKKIHIKLASSKYFNEVDVMPELEQIQSYIRYRRKLIGDNNDLDHLSEYIESLRFEEGKTNEFELIIFGDEMGNGSDQSHFHLGFTTAKLLLRIKCLSDGCYHIDATYKIVKYSYPLIVFGFSDRSRKFYPIAFMFTSHEEVRDYEHFFDSFLVLCRKFNIDFQPKYIVSDASKAIRRAIKSNFPNACYVTCWFHLKMNVKKHKNLIPKQMTNGAKTTWNHSKNTSINNGLKVTLILGKYTTLQPVMQQPIIQLNNTMRQSKNISQIVLNLICIPR